MVVFTRRSTCACGEVIEASAEGAFLPIGEVEHLLHRAIEHHKQTCTGTPIPLVGLD